MEPPIDNAGYVEGDNESLREALRGMCGDWKQQYKILKMPSVGYTKRIADAALKRIEKLEEDKHEARGVARGMAQALTDGNADIVDYYVFKHPWMVDVLP